MSVVLSYVDAKVAIVASDGRVVDSNGKIVDEHYSKIAKINKSVIVGYAGQLNGCRQVVDLLTNPDKEGFISQLRVEHVVDFISEFISRSTIPDGIHIGFLVCGKSKDGRMCSANVSNYSPKSIVYPTMQEPHIQGIYPAPFPGKEDLLRDCIECHGVKMGMEETVRQYASMFHDVNTNIYFNEVYL